MPMMPFIGVRISWLMLARNSLLARLAGFGRLLGAGQRLLGELARGAVAVDREEPDLAAVASRSSVIDCSTNRFDGVTWYS